MRNRLVIQAVLSLTVLALAAPASAGTQRVPQDHDTIQEAVDAAAAGDRILISKGTYFENVVANEDGLQFVARGKVVWDGNVAGSSGKQLEVRGNDTLVQGIRFRHGEYQVDLVGNNTVVRRCSSIGAQESFVSVYGARTATDPDDFINNPVSSPSEGEFKATGSRVEANKVDGCFGAGLRIHSDDAVVRNNRFTHVTAKGAFVFGNDALVERNKVNDSYVFGLHVVGDDMVVQRNSLVNVRIKAIGVSGDNSMVLNNRITRVAILAGIMWEEDDDETHDDVDRSIYDPSQTPSVAGPTITGNRIKDTGQTGIRCYDDNVSVGGTVEKNVITNGGGRGIDADVPEMDLTNNRITNVATVGVLVEADDMNLTGNRVKNSGSGMGTPAFYIEGSDVTVTKCSATNVFGDGFHVDDGEDNVSFIDCVAKNCSEDGFDVESSTNDDTSLLRCKALKCGGEGLDNAGLLTDVTNCLFKGNRIDLANDGTFDVYTGNNVAAADAKTDEVDTSTDNQVDDVED